MHALDKIKPFLFSVGLTSAELGKLFCKQKIAFFINALAKHKPKVFKFSKLSLSVYTTISMVQYNYTN